MIIIQFPFEQIAQTINHTSNYNQFNATTSYINVTKEGKIALFGNYIDTIDIPDPRTGNRQYAFVATPIPEHYTLLKTPYYPNLGSIISNDKTIQINDSEFVYHFLKSDSLYKRLENWFVVYNHNGDTTRTFELKTYDNFGIKQFLYLKESNEYIILGYDSANITEKSYSILYKINYNGDVIWKKKILTTIAHKFNGLTLSNNNEIILSGYDITNNIDPNTNWFRPYVGWYYFKKYDLNGTQISQKLFNDSIGPGSSVYPLATLKYSNSSFLLITLGVYDNNWISKTTTDSTFIILIDSNWSLKRKINLRNYLINDSFIFLFNLLYLKEGNSLVFGRTRNPSSDPQKDYVSNNIVIKLDKSLNPIWKRRYIYDSTTLTNEIADITESNSGELYMSGSVSYSNNHYKSWLIKTDSFGCLVPGCQLFDGVQDIKSIEKTSFKSFPNPSISGEDIQIECNKLSEGKQIIVLSHDGKLIHKETIIGHTKYINLHLKEINDNMIYILLINNGSLEGGILHLIK